MRKREKNRIDYGSWLINPCYKDNISEINRGYYLNGAIDPNDNTELLDLESEIEYIKLAIDRFWYKLKELKVEFTEQAKHLDIESNEQREIGVSYGQYYMDSNKEISIYMDYLYQLLDEKRAELFLRELNAEKELLTLIEMDFEGQLESVAASLKSACQLFNTPFKGLISAKRFNEDARLATSLEKDLSRVEEELAFNDNQIHALRYTKD